ncbi:MAG: biosynthetic-type acetolactate synthase large subunit [Oligoflexia bacterium]|nr:biosynthetic-type acetolactate synthase large subunit [Oligoflexia bacterium]
MKGSKILLECLKKEGVNTIFGYPGAVILPLFDELIEDKSINMVLVRHEQGAAHMADGYARSTGKAGVCLATSGPGATNLVTGIATAFMDSIPLVALTGQIPTSLIGNDAFQEADITGITRPIVKHSYIVKSVEDLPQIIKHSFHIAQTGRPGPVLIDLPKNILVEEIQDFTYPETVDLRGYKPKYEGHKLQIKKAVDLIENAKRPLIYAGGGVISSGAADELLKFVEKTNIPVTTTLLGLGAIPSSHPLFIGMLGMHGTKYANYAVQESDLLIAIGARFDDRVTGNVDDFAPHAKKIHIDIDPAAIRKIITVDVPIVGDAKNILRELNCKKTKHSEWVEQIYKWKEQYPLYYKDNDEEIKPQYIIEKVNELTRGNAIITTEVGQHQMWAAQYYKVEKPRTFLTSGGLGTMGYGFPAAIGAQAGNPDKLVIDFAGDGSIQMNMQELATAVSYCLPVKVIIFNNGCLGMIRQFQELFFNKRYCHICICKDIDFVKIAEGYGARGYRITKKSDVETVLKEAFEFNGPALIDCKIPEEENVWPMVAAGNALSKMMDGMA